MPTNIASKIYGGKGVHAYAVVTYIFFLALILQNSIAFSVKALGLELPVSVIYVFKDIVLLGMVGLLLMTKVVFKFSRFDQVALLILLYLVVFALVKGSGLNDMIMQLRFYLVPILLYFIGRNMSPFLREADLIRFILVISSAYVLVSLVFILIDREVLLQMGLGQLLSEKLGHFGREDAVMGGLPINFYFYHTNGELTNRAFGANFDPLSSAFLGGCLFFYLFEICKRTTSKLARVLTICVGLIVVLTLTRAIIIGMLLALAVYQFKKRRLRWFSVFMLALTLLVAIVSYNMSYIQDSLDPSTKAHLSAYSDLDESAVVTENEDVKDKVRGAESLYLTVIQEYGIGLFLLYAVWLLMVYRFLRKHYCSPYTYATVAAMFVYLLASLTTEHWFSFTSGALFWFLLGNNLTAIQGGVSENKIKLIRKVILPVSEKNA
ncbi:MAG: hypothetical protein QM484_05135 [Woeseiaceae bacterium]